MRQSFNPEPPDDKVVPCGRCEGLGMVCANCGGSRCDCPFRLAVPPGGEVCSECNGDGEKVVPA